MSVGSGLLVTDGMKSLDQLEGVGLGEAVAPQWKVYDWGRARGLAGVKGIWKMMDRLVDAGGPVGLIRIDDEFSGWWKMMDVKRVCNDGEGSTGSGLMKGWDVIGHQSLQRVKAMYRMMGVDRYVELCENPDNFEEDHGKNERGNIDATLRGGLG